MNAMQVADGRDRRQTVPLQHATEFPDETGKYEIESVSNNGQLPDINEVDINTGAHL